MHRYDKNSNEYARPISTAVLFDLDATLFDYTSLRHEATAAALDGVVAEPRRVSGELLELLRPPLTDVLVQLGFRNLRQEWDSAEVLMLACALDDPAGRKDLLAVAEAAGGLKLPEADESLAYKIAVYRFAEQLRQSSAMCALAETIAGIRQSSGEVLAQRARTFRTYVDAHASLAKGVSDVVAELTECGAEVHVVSEGNTAVQTSKFNSLGLAELMHSCVVTDATCGAGPVVAELVAHNRQAETIPAAVYALHDQLAAYAVKSTAFFSKLLHALADERPGTTLQERMQSPRFLTADEWDCARPFNIAMVGDRYRKDLEPLLRLCLSGVRTYRVLTGRYQGEDTIHDLLDADRPLPHGYFPDIPSLGGMLAEMLKQPGEAVSRPVPVLPDVETIDAVLDSNPKSAPRTAHTRGTVGDALSERSRAVLLGLRAEAIRQRGA